MSGWTVETLNSDVDAELAALPADIRAQFTRISLLIEVAGLTDVHEPHVKHLEGDIWEMRLKGATIIARALYVTANSKRVVVVRAFVKKKQKTPRKEIEIAKLRAKQVK